MELTVDMSVPASVEIGATGLRGLAQEIRTALATRKGSVPLDRDFDSDHGHQLPVSRAGRIRPEGHALDLDARDAALQPPPNLRDEQRP